MKQHAGQIIRTLRRLNNRTLHDLAAEIGHTAGWLSHVERGIFTPRNSDLVCIAAALGVPVEALAGGHK